MSPEASYLTLTVEKGHILTLGERLYEQSIELIRELVNNAYAPGRMRTLSINGAMEAVDEYGQPVDEARRTAAILATTCHE